MNLNQVTIPSLNVEKAIAFYQLLGLKLIVSALPRYARLECPSGDATFSIHQVEELAKGGAGITVYFENDDLDNYVAALERKGVAFDELPVDQPWLWREARLKDPDNNQLVIYYAGTNRKDPPWKINE
jgi:catechol 2,3-dioxygenase-like lactoylglutathione lyase family enzyme